MKKSKTEKQLQTWFWKTFDQHVRKCGLKQTQQRRLIAKYFLYLNSHVSVEDLNQMMRKDGHNTGVATIYRTLHFLSSAGLAEQKSFQEGKSAVFEIRNPHHHHDHLICTSCGKVVEFENDKIEKLQKEIAGEQGFQLLSHRLDLFGYCKSCNRKRVNTNA